MLDDASFTVTDGLPPEPDDAAIARLAKLDPLAYDRVREEEAKRLGVRVVILDRLVAAARGDGAGHAPGQGRKLTLPSPEPWPEPVDGAALLDRLAAFLSRHVFLPSGAADGMAAWAVHTHCFTRFRHTPRLALTSADKRCGKTTALDALALLVARPLATANITSAALFRTVELAAPTLLIDEADTFLRHNEDLRGALNAGHKRGGQVIRCIGDDAEPRAFSVFGPAAVAAIGALPATIADRAIRVRMQRATRAERPAPLNHAAEAEGERVAHMAARWCQDNAARLPDEPVLPPALFNRSADNWRPLFAIAELAGAGWPERLTTASAALAPDDDDDGRGVRLLADIRTVFDAREVDRLASADLVAALVAMETSPWAEANHGRAITTNGLARWLKAFGVLPSDKREGNRVSKGYRRAAFEDAWTRYLPDPAQDGPIQPLHRYTRTATANSDDQQPLHGPDGVAVGVPGKARNSAVCSGVAVEYPVPGEASAQPARNGGWL